MYGKHFRDEHFKSRQGTRFGCERYLPKFGQMLTDNICLLDSG